MRKMKQFRTKSWMSSADNVQSNMISDAMGVLNAEIVVYTFFQSRLTYSR